MLFQDDVRNSVVHLMAAQITHGEIESWAFRNKIKLIIGKNYIDSLS